MSERIEIKRKDYELLSIAPYLISLLKQASPFVMAFALEDDNNKNNIKFREMAGGLLNKITEVGEYWEKHGLPFFPVLTKNKDFNSIKIKVDSLDGEFCIPINEAARWEKCSEENWKEIIIQYKITKKERGAENVES